MYILVWIEQQQQNSVEMINFSCGTWFFLLLSMCIKLDEKVNNGIRLLDWMHLQIVPKWIVDVSLSFISAHFGWQLLSSLLFVFSLYPNDTFSTIENTVCRTMEEKEHQKTGWVKYTQCTRLHVIFIHGYLKSSSSWNVVCVHVIISFWYYIWESEIIFFPMEIRDNLTNFELCVLFSVSFIEFNMWLNFNVYLNWNHIQKNW